ncbi:hypothetical protein EWM64_g7464 [Hericium alpestre]|uniref:Uncharacterized protein n=1 Tax=Hericium alpestre TaxID=135208 RepID=A0A4Y9ZR72_9AGAM|nr:hypothetical protein EWM64_g7464 [Hericium alpestre]
MEHMAPMPASPDSEPPENEEIQQRWPFTTARSTGTEHQDLLAALLTADTLDEISNADDYDAVARYIRSQGRVDVTGKIICGLAFWLYPTGLYGPYHEVQGGIHKYGTLITVEPGALLDDAMARIKSALRQDGIAHEHVGGSPPPQ